MNTPQRCDRCGNSGIVRTSVPSKHNGAGFVDTPCSCPAGVKRMNEPSTWQVMQYPRGAIFALLMALALCCTGCSEFEIQDTNHDGVPDRLIMRGSGQSLPIGYTSPVPNPGDGQATGFPAGDTYWSEGVRLRANGDIAGLRLWHIGKARECRVAGPYLAASGESDRTGVIGRAQAHFEAGE